MSIPEGTYTFESVAFPGVFLRMDGGQGVVNCQYGSGSYEKYKLKCIEEHHIYSIESAAFNGIYLRMDGSEVKSFSGSGSGVVNTQTRVGSYEKFKLIYNGDDCTFSVESNKWPGVFLRVDGTGVDKFTGSGGGIVNCQYGAKSYERFKLKSA